MEAFMAKHQDQVTDCMKLCAPTDPNDQAPTTLAKEAFNVTDKTSPCSWPNKLRYVRNHHDPNRGTIHLQCCSWWLDTSRDRRGTYKYCDIIGYA